MMIFVAVAETNIVLQIRSELLALRSQANISADSYYEFIEDWKSENVTTNAGFIALEQAVNSNWRAVLSGIAEVTTNREDRLVLMAALSCSGETNFLQRIDAVADMVISNQLTLGEMFFFENRCYGRDHFAASVLVRRCHEPAVSNLIRKVETAGGYPDGTDNLFNGEAKRSYEAGVESGLFP